MSPVTGGSVRLAYDEEADAAYLYLADAIDDDVVTRADPAGDRLVVESGPDGRLLGIEVPHASRTLPHDLLRRLTDRP